MKLLPLPVRKKQLFSEPFSQYPRLLKLRELSARFFEGLSNPSGGTVWRFFAFLAVKNGPKRIPQKLYDPFPIGAGERMDGPNNACRIKWFSNLVSLSAYLRVSAGRVAGVYQRILV